MNYIEMSKVCESCQQVNNPTCMDCEQCKNCKILNQQEKIRMVNSYNMKDVYEEVNDASVDLEVDGKDLIIRIPYLAGDAEDIIRILKSRGDQDE